MCLNFQAKTMAFPENPQPMTEHSVGLGAGFSAQRGAPLTNSLCSKARHWTDQDFVNSALQPEVPWTSFASSHIFHKPNTPKSFDLGLS